MPQCRRSVAFSTKQKKEQLKLKRERKKFVPTSEYDTNKSTTMYDDKKNVASFEVKKIPISTSKKPSFELKRNVPNSAFLYQRNNFLGETEEIGGAATSRGNRYNLKFRKTNKDLNKFQYEPILRVSEEDLEVDCNSFFPRGMDYPRRPQWRPCMSKAELNQNENRSFRLFCEEIDRSYPGNDLSLYELNLETWRQLWRVKEMSDILLIIVDARYSAAQFPPYLYEHLTEKENKGVILILNKCDLLPPSLVLAWQDYFTTNFPKLLVLPFSSLEGKVANKSRLNMATQSSLKLIEACRKIVDGKVDLSSWHDKVKAEEKESETAKCQIVVECEEELDALVPESKHKYNGGILTIGTIGHPNVGKSSLINALMGKKVVSVSRTPGHTKYFQTIFITKNIKLCDCPGLVFPSLCPRQMQVIIGSYPIAQVRDPLTTIHFIASRLDLPSLLKLQVLEEEEPGREFQWTPFYICEAWAKRRGYTTRTKGARPDVYRAANELLRFTLVGFKALVLSFKPPGYSKHKGSYRSDPRREDVELVQGLCSKSLRRESEGEEEEEQAIESDGEESEGDEKSSSEEEEVEEKKETSNEGNKFALLSLDD